MARIFYHNIGGNTSASNFNITRIYPNKEELLLNASTDGIYPGSYVLVDYDKDYNPAVYDSTSEKWSFDPSFAYKLGWETEADDYYEPTSEHYLLLSTNPNTGQEIYYLYSDDIIEEVDDPFYGSSTKALKITKDTVIYVEHYTGESGKSAYHYDFYRCIGKATSIIDGENPRPEYAEFKKLEENEWSFNQETGIVKTGLDAYTENYQKDKAAYGNIGRGYDGTVWQKAIIKGSQSYVQIAELNSAVPTFSFNLVKPEEDGMSPYVDYNISSNMYYEMYDSPHWGFRVKDANYINTRTTDSTNYPHEDGSDLAIYWNEKGFNPAIIGEDKENTTNFIKVDSTGISGRKYGRVSDPDNQTTGEDIQELSIILPDLGNTISNIWDIVYGNEEVNKYKWNLNKDLSLGGIYDTAYNKQRITDIGWHNANESEAQKTKGLRLVNTTGEPGYPYSHLDALDDESKNPVQTQTLAGCINSIHDLMGMIIYNPSSDPETGDEIPTSVDRNDAAALEQFRQKWAELSSDYIYYLGGEYYRRGVAVALNENYDPNNLWTEVEVTEYDPNIKYFYKDLTNYIRIIPDEGKVPDNNIACYKFIDEPNDMKLIEDLGSEFKGNIYSYREDYDSSWNVEPYQEIKGRDYYYVVFSFDNLVFWKPGIYYTKKNPDGEIITSNLQVSNQPIPSENTVYYYPYQYNNYNPSIGRYEEITGYVGINSSEFTVFNPSDSFKYYSQVSEHKFVPISYSNVQDYMWKAPDNFDQKEQIRYKMSYAIINEEESQLAHPIKFYHANEYYYKSDENSDVYDYLKDTSNTKQAGRIYYDLIREPIAVGKFYEPYKFYDHEHNLHYTGYDSSETYYEEQKLYVIESGILEDGNGNPVGNGRLYKVGSEWGIDDGQPKTPEHLLQEYGVKCGVKELYYEPFKLQGFARNLNTIHGMLLRIDALIGDSNNNDKYLNGKLIRDTNTLQGCINQLNDYIDLFDTIIKPDHIMMADKTGKYGTAEIASDPWILLDTSGQTELRLNPDTNEYEDVYIGPQLEITHKSAVIDTSAATAIDLNTTGSDTVNLLVTDFDAKGHATAKKVQTVTLPFGFKKLKSSAQSEDDAAWSTAAQSTDITIEADNTQDELTFTVGNKWLRVSTDTINDKLTLAHETHQKTTSDTQQNLSDESGITTFNVYNYTFDAAGHIDNEDTKTITMPASYGKIAGDSGNTTATATLDTLNILGTDNWIQTAVTADQVSITHEAPVAVTPTAKSNDTPQFGSTFTIEDLSFDTKGHKNGLGTHTVTIPQLNLATATLSPNSDSNVLVKIGLSDVENAVGKTITPQEKYVGALYLNNFLPATGTNHYYDSSLTINQFAGATDTNFDTINTNLTAVNQNLTSRINDTNTRVDTIVNTTIPAAIQTAKDHTDSVINALKGENLSEAFDTLKEIQEWINDGNQQGTALVNRVASLESSLGDLNGSGSGSVSSQISSAVAVVQGNTTTTVADLETSLNNYVLKSEATGYDDILTATDAAAAYQPLLTAGVDYVEPNDIDDMVETTTEFAYVYGGTSTDMTIDDLMTYIATLEARIEALENAGTDPEPSGGGEEPEPQTSDIEIEFTSGVGAVNTGTFADAWTNINGADDYTYNVIIDGISVPVISKNHTVVLDEPPGVETIYLYLDNNDPSTYYVEWTASAINLIDNR